MGGCSSNSKTHQAKEPRLSSGKGGSSSELVAGLEKSTPKDAVGDSATATFSNGSAASQTPVRLSNDSAASQTPIRRISFRTKYSFGEALGKGGNASVMECTELSSGKIYAVKLLELAKHAAELEQEVKMMRLMEGCPNCVQLKDSFLGSVFGYIVMDKFIGDVVHAMVDYISLKGKCSESILRPIFRQMVASVAWLHTKDLLHRDVKSDNFLLDRADVSDPNVRIVLSDMGTVVQHPKDQFLNARVGTALYWSPEVVKKRYSYPADVWALGVIVYSVMLGLFPFRSPEHLLSQNEPSYTRGGVTLSANTQKFLSQVLVKDVQHRITADDIMHHSWLNEEGSIADGAARIHENLATKVEGRNLGKEEIRDKEEKGGGMDMRPSAKEQAIVSLDPFETTEADGTRFNWEWWPEHMLGGMLGSRKGMADNPNIRTLETSTWNVAKVVELLARHGIDKNLYGVGKANTVEQMLKELVHGEAQLYEEQVEGNSSPKLVRVVQVVLLRLKNIKSGELLIETHLATPDGRTKEVNRLLGTKMTQDENYKSCARRLLKNYLGMGSQELRSFCRLHAVATIERHGSGLTTNEANAPSLQVEKLEEGPSESPAYPGINTIYHKCFLDGDVDPEGVTPSAKERYGLAGGVKTFTQASKLNDTRSWKWTTPAECQSLGIVTRGTMIKAGPTQRPRTSIKAEIWSLARVTETLLKHNVDISKYGVGKAYTLQKLADEISSGEVSILEHTDADLSMQGDGMKHFDLVRAVNIVVLRLRQGDKSNSHLVVEASHTLVDGREIVTNRLPAMKMKSRETVWGVARRLVDTKLGLKEADVNINTGMEDIVDEEKESASFPGLTSLYRKHFVDATYKR